MTDLTLYEYSDFNEDEIKTKLQQESKIILQRKGNTGDEPKSHKQQSYKQTLTHIDFRRAVKRQLKSILSSSRFLLKRNYYNP